MRRSMSDATRLVPPDTGSTVSFMRLGHDQTLRLESPTNPIRKSADLRQTMWLLVSPSSFQMLPRIHDRRLHLRVTLSAVRCSDSFVGFRLEGNIMAKYLTNSRITPVCENFRGTSA
ncbi:hypothetical protein DMN91_003481 [Ooceraea biroi]|uniref:Uncharacterized protein n=1 Tax=Ooceraea biroi TaxID=2015173 RepID=A0A3L8DU50_OOCBI|nr:hypothetical protein DMN91_003481 [Ooceraea biroi]